MIKNQDYKLRFYSQRAIAIATFFGGPLAAGYLVRQNFINLDKEDYGKYALIIGVLSTLLIFVVIFSIPEHIIEKIPSPLIPAIYTLIIYFIIEKLQGEKLNEHKKSNGEFQSAWKAAGVGFICTVIISGGVLGYVYLATDNFDAKKYDSQLAIFSENESIALELFNKIEHSQKQELLTFIDSIGLPLWEINIKILDELDKMEGIYEELIIQNGILRNYCNLRIEQYKIIRNAVFYDATIDEIEMQKIAEKIDYEISKLNN